jgi:hypothetical protein
MFNRGFNAIKVEEERREKAKELRKGRLFRFYLKDKEEDVPVIFLTEEPINFWEHTFDKGKVNVPCSGDDCEYCADEDKYGKARFVSAWLVVDRREYSYKDQSGKEISGKDRIKLMVRGMTNAAVLEKHSAKYGLMKYEWGVTRTGKDTTTTWLFDRGEKLSLTAKQLEAIMAQLPENMCNLDPYEIVELQITGAMELEATNDRVTPEISEEAEKQVMDGVQDIEDKEEDVPAQKLTPATQKITPKRKPLGKNN